jgi:hypothetical protein
MRAARLGHHDQEIGTLLRAGARALVGMVPPRWTAPSTVRPVDYRIAPQSPPSPDGSDAGLSVRNAEDVHRVVDPLPPGRHPNVKTLPTPEAITGLYGQLTQDSAPGPPSTYPGQWRVLEDGTKVGLRPTSKFGGPTVEIWYPGGLKTDVHLEERPKPPNTAPLPVPVPVPVPSLPAAELPREAPPLASSGDDDIGIGAVLGGIGVGVLASLMELGKEALSP